MKIATLLLLCGSLAAQTRSITVNGCPKVPPAPLPVIEMPYECHDGCFVWLDVSWDASSGGAIVGTAQLSTCQAEACTVIGPIAPVGESQPLGAPGLHRMVSSQPVYGRGVLKVVPLVARLKGQQRVSCYTFRLEY